MNIPFLNNITLQGVLSTPEGTSIDWTEAYTNLVSNSAAYLLSGTDINLGQIPTLSGTWTTAYTNLVANSAAYLSGVDISLLAAASGNWNSNYTTTNTNSAFWTTAYTNLVSNSAAYLQSGTGVNLGDIPVLSGNWNSNYTTTNTFSSSWTDYGSTVPIASNSVTLELSAFSYFLINLNANITSMTFNNPKTAPQITSFVLQLSADGALRSITWPVSVRWPGGTAPIVTNAVNKVDTYTFFSYDGGISYYGYPTGYNS